MMSPLVSMWVAGMAIAPSLAHSHHAQPPLVVTLEDEHDLIAVDDAQLLEISGSAVGLLLELAEGGTHFLATLAGAQQADLIGLQACPLVHDIVGKVEILGNNKMKVILEILFRREMRLSKESFYHDGE